MSPDYDVLLTGGGAATCAIADRAAKLKASVDVTYHAEATSPGLMSPVANDQTATNPTIGDTAVNIDVLNVDPNSLSFPDGVLGLGWTTELWGDWPILPGDDPAYLFSIVGGCQPILSTTNPSISGSTSMNDDYSSYMVEQLVMNGPQPTTLFATIVDPLGSGETVQVSYKMKVHAPIESPILSRGAYQDYDTGLVTEVASCPATSTLPITLGLSFTGSLSIQVGFKLDPLAQLENAIASSLGVSFGLTGTFAINTTLTMSIPPGEEGRWHAYLRRVPLTLSGDGYGANGFIGPTAYYGWDAWSQASQMANVIFKPEYWTIGNAPPNG